MDFFNDFRQKTDFFKGLYVKKPFFIKNTNLRFASALDDFAPVIF